MFNNTKTGKKNYSLILSHQKHHSQVTLLKAKCTVKKNTTINLYYKIKHMTDWLPLTQVMSAVNAVVYFNDMLMYTKDM